MARTNPSTRRSAPDASSRRPAHRCSSGSGAGELAAIALLLLGAVAAALLCVAPPASAAPPSGIVWTAEIDGAAVPTLTAQHPLSLATDRSPTISVHLRNLQSHELRVRSVRLESRVLGLTFLNSETRVDIAVAPGQAASRTYRIDLFGVRQQATGLLPARVVLLDDSGRAVSSRGFALRLHGSWWSVYGRFGFAVAALTLVLLATVLWELMRGRQPRRRWQRGLSLALPGLGLGFVLLFILSASGMLLPSPLMGAVFLGAAAVLGFIAGVLTPNPYRGGHEAPSAVHPVDVSRPGRVLRREQAHG